jgi:hypothetical protein
LEDTISAGYHTEARRWISPSPDTQRLAGDQISRAECITNRKPGYAKVVESNELQHNIETRLADELRTKLAARIAVLAVDNPNATIVDSAVEEVQKCVNEVLSSLQPSNQMLSDQTGQTHDMEMDGKVETTWPAMSAMSEPDYTMTGEMAASDIFDCLGAHAMYFQNYVPLSKLELETMHYGMGGGAGMDASGGFHIGDPASLQFWPYYNYCHMEELSRGTESSC